jgi:uncharacterized protein with PQ loop repeat
MIPKLFDSVASSALWATNTLYVVSLIPQIRLNYKLKTTQGLSPTMIWCLLIGYVLHLYYIFCFDLPLSYKVTVPFAIVGSMTLWFQRLYYDKNLSASYLAYLCSVSSFFIIVSTIIFTYYNCFGVGVYVGWLATIIWSLYFFPQIISIFTRRSTQGFSFSFISLMAFGTTIELISAIILKLPLPTSLGPVRGIVAYIIFCVAFYLYKK